MDPLGTSMLVVEDHRLELLMTYTTFHIGLYMSLVGALIAAEKFEIFSSGAVRFSIICFLIAGACGGLIAVNVAEFDLAHHHISDFYHGYKLHFWCFETLPYAVFAFVEHFVFWMGILFLLARLLWPKKARKAHSPP
jgi:hypothetical protein